MKSSEQILKVENLGFKYNEKEILKDICFTLEVGDFVGILGPNGCGKTTLLKNINRWLKPDTGNIYVNGESIYRVTIKDLAKRVATVPQDTYLDVAFTVEQIVLMGRNPHLKNFESEQKEDIAIVEDAMKSMDILHLRDKPVHQLSGGERQRVLIARALAQQPSLLLLDEPTSHLDINYQWELLGLLKDLCLKKSLTILVVLHDINLASMFCNKIILLKDHKIFKMGDLNEVLNEDNIKAVFDMDVRVVTPKGNPKPVVIFLNTSDENEAIFAKKPKPFHKLHVICGGGEGEELLSYLGQRGYEVSVGVLNKGDSDWETARRLGFDIVEEIPFSPISDENAAKNISYIEKADAVILANIPFGLGNLKNIMCLEGFIGRKDIYILEENDINERDYTNGAVVKIYNKIKDKAVVFKSMQELKEII